MDFLIDYITEKKVQNVGAEENRQAVEHFLVEQKGFAKQDIMVDTPICFEIDNDTYCSQIDLVIMIDGIGFMAVKCAAGSLGSREKEVISGARLLKNDYQIPFSLVSDGKDALIFDTVTGKRVGMGLESIPTKAEARNMLKHLELSLLPENRKRKEKLIFRSYDSMNVNVHRE